MATSVGCSSEPDASACDGVWCESGVCDPATQACVNPTTCTDGDECLPGFSCESSQCVADFACDADNTCARGECVNGACMNASECSVEANCVPGYYCGEGGTCQVNSCEDTTCDRGQCIPATGQCENAATCTRATEKVDCLEGNYCMGQICVSAEAVCAELGCENGRGVCDPAARACVDAENCAGDDQNCVAGSFCNASNKCQVNQCEPDTGQCDRGVCEPGTGSCVNAPSCSNQDACVDGYFCIDGTCEAQATACAECTGNQVCTQNNTTLSAECAESPLGCFNGLGCLDDRVCVDGSCVDSPACEADSFEPNNTSEEATSLNEEQQNGAIQASLCNGDVDVYTFDTRGLGLTRGTLWTELRVQGQDLGNANFKVVVRNSAGEVRAEGVGTGRSVISLEVPVNAAQQGLYTIEITDLGGSKTAGLRYNLFADFISTNITNACGNDNVKELNPGLINANSLNGATYELGSTCTSATNTAREDIYQFTLTERSYVNFIARPAADVEITMSLRQSCLSMLSEFQCANLGGRGQPERLAMTLDPGTYFLIVKGPRASTGGAYSLEYIRETSVCQPGVPYCTNAQTSAVCNDRGTAHTQVLCSNGCVEDGGYCDGEPGDTCFVAIDATGGFTGTINWSQLNNDYNLGDDADKCLPVNDQGATIGTVADGLVGGPDQVYVVNVGGGESLQVDLTTTGLDHGSVYIVNDCQDQANTCQAGAFTSVATRQGFRKTLVWHNESTQSERIYVVADGGKTLGGPANITIAHGPVSCIPNTTQCSGDTLEVCNISGTAYQASRECSFGCGTSTGTAACNMGQNNVCKGAFDIVAEGGTYEGFIDDYTNEYNAGARGCAWSTTLGTNGPDATFFIDADKGEVITATLIADFSAALWITTDCSDAARSCISGSRRGPLATEFVQFEAPEKGRYYIIVDSVDNKQYGAFRLDASAELPMCPPGNVIGCAADGKTLMYCGDLGTPVSHVCSTSCTGMACDEPNGDVCADAIPVQHGDTVVGNFSGSNAVNPGVGQVGQCEFPSGNDFSLEDQGPNGIDTIYSVDLKAGQVLHVSGVLQNSSEFMRTVVYLLENCADATNSCVANTKIGEHPDLVYTATEDKTVFVVVDRLNPNSHASGYTLNFNVFEQECTPGERTCRDEFTQRTCTPEGFYSADFVCQNGCQAGSCIDPAGDVCADAIELHHLDVVTGNFMGTNTMEMGRAMGQCEFGTHDMYGGPGPETFYRIDMLGGQRLVADLRSGTSATMYILEDCTRPTTCLANTPNQLNSNDYRLEYVSDRDKTIFLVVDKTISAGTSTQTYELSIDLQAGDCATPGEYSCMEDRKTLGLCGDDGNYTYYRCAEGCRNDRCERTALGGLCVDQIKLKSGDSVTGNFDNVPHLAIDPADAGSCNFASLSEPLQSPSTMYSIDMQEGELLVATLDARNTVAWMYVLDDCAQGTSSCQEAVGPKNNHSELLYVADRDKTVTLVVASNSTNRSKNEFFLNVNLQTPGCVDASTTCLDASTLGVCTPEGYYAPHHCSDGCNNGRCNTADGQVCADAIEIYEGVEVTVGHWTGYNAIDAGPGVSGLCDFGTTGTPGREMIYAIDVPGGQVVRAKLTSSHNAIYNTLRMYALEECGVTDSCVANSAASDEELVFINEHPQRLYLVIDRSVEATTTYTYSLLVTFEPAGCIPGALECNQDGTGMQLCNDIGIWEALPCASNSCSNDSCDEPNAHTCQDAMPVQSGQTVTGDWTTARGNDIDLGSGSVGQCEFTAATNGNDMVYSIELKADEILTVTQAGRVLGNTLYIMEDCYDGNSCLANEYISSSSATLPPLQYRADRDKTVFVVVDRAYSSNSSNQFSLSFDVQPSLCTPGARECQGDHLGLCNEFHLWDTYTCDDGCSNNACNTPRGDACFDAIPLVPNSGLVAGDWSPSNRTNSLNPGPGTVGGCTFSGTTEQLGPDTIYAIPVTAGEILRADLSLSSNLSAARMYILSSCEDAQSCMVSAANAVNSHMFLTHQVAQDGILYLVVDYTTAAGSSTASYSLNVTSNPACTAGHQRCSADGTMLEICNGDTATYESFECAFDSCTNDACTTPTGYYCQDAVPLVSGDKVNGQFKGSTGPLNPGSGVSGQCNINSTTSGGEVIYSIQLYAGEVLSATAVSTSAAMQMYLLEDCFDTNTCLEYVPYPPANQAVTLNYLAEQDRTVFLVVDERNASSSHTFELEIDISNSGECIPGETVCIDGTTLNVCNPLGTFNAYACDGACAVDRCVNPTGNTCFDAIPVTSGFHMLNAYQDATSEMDPGTGTCFVDLHMALTGKERVFSVELNEGDVLKARIQGSNISPQTAMYVLDNCEQSTHDACIYGVQKSETLEFYAPNTQTYFLVLDGANPNNNIQVWIDIEEAAATCQFGESTCDPVDGVVSLCAEDGSGITEHFQCAYGCGPGGRCAGAPQGGDTCDTAVAITAPTRLIENWGKFEPDYNMNSAGCRNGTGRDAVYKISLAPGQMVRASAESLHATYHSIVYLVEECPDTATSCLVSDIATSSKRQSTLEYLSPNGGEYFLVVDVSSTAAAVANNHFVLDIDFEMAECVPGAQRCDIDGVDLEVCSESGLWENSPCPYGCGNDVCLPAQNNTCAGAFDAGSGLDITIELDDYTHDYDAAAGSAVSCTGRETNGPEALFFVDVEKNDVISVAATASGAYPAVWITTSCSGNSAELANACVAGHGVTSGNQAQTSYRAPEAGRYYILADTYFSTISGRYPAGSTLNVVINVEPAVCDAFEVTCLDANTVAYCVANGSGFAEYTCNDGCNNGICGTPRGGLCTDAILATAGGTFTGNFSDVPNTSDPGFGSCTGFEAPGPDAFYAVEMTAGQTLTATLSNGAGVENDLSLYVVTDCTDSRNTCEAGSDKYGVGAETITYTATQSGVVYVVADAWNSNASGEFQLTVNVQ